MLILFCDCCNLPMEIPDHIEMVLSGCKYIICGNCKGVSVVPNEVKQDIRMKWGMK